MPERFDIFKGFKAAKDMIGAYPDPYEEERKFQRQMQLENMKAGIQSPKDQAMTNYYNAQTDFLKGGGESNQDFTSGNMGGTAQMLGVPEEDLILKPAVNRFRGRTTVSNVPELKPPMQEAGSQMIRSGRTSSMGMIKNLQSMTPGIQKKMGPVMLGHISAIKGGIGDTLLNLQSALGDGSAKDFATFKQSGDILFQQWRKFITGVQAAYPEIQMLSPDYPQPTDTPEVYTEKAYKLLNQAQDIENQVLSFESQRGYRTGDLREGSLSNNPIVQQAMAQRGGGTQQSFPPSSGGNSLRQEAQQAIARGADPKKVAERYRQQTGEDY